MPSTLNLTWTRGDSKTEPLQLLNAAGDPIDLAAPVVIKWTVKEEDDDLDKDALFQKVNRTAATVVQGADEIEVTDVSEGRIVLKARKADTVAVDPGCYPHDIELTRAGDEVAAAEVGTVAVAAGVAAVVGTGTLFTLLHVGDMLLLTSGDNANKVPVCVVKITDDEHMTTDYTGWITAAALAISKAFVGDVKTPALGKVTLTKDVTR